MSCPSVQPAGPDFTQKTRPQARPGAPAVISIIQSEAKDY
jgi:hypothetical protein